MFTTPGPVAAEHGGDPRSQSVAAVMEAVFQHYPNLARRVGRYDFDARLPQSCVRTAEEFGGLSAAAERQLRELPGDADPELRADLDTAARLAGVEAFRAADLGETHLAPFEVLAETDMSTYLSDTYAPLDHRLAALEVHLERLPAFLREAALVLPPELAAGERLSGIEHARARSLDMVDFVARAAQTEGLFEPEVAVRVAGAADRASAACLGYARALEATQPSSGLLGHELLGEYLHRAEGIERDPDHLLAEAQDEVAWLVSALASTARELGTTDRTEALALMADEVGDAPVAERAKLAIERLQSFWSARQVVSTDTVLPLEVRTATGHDVATTVQFSAAPALARRGQPHVLSFPDPSRAKGGQGAPDRQHYFNDPRLELIAVHEAFPGHYIHAEASARGSGEIRKCFAGVFGSTEGWAHYAEELAVDQGLADGRPLVRFAQLYAAVESAVRLVGWLSLHLHRSTFAEGATSAVLACGWSEERSARELLAAVAEPGPAMYTLGKLNIRQWRGGADEASAGGLKAFHDRVMECGHAPLITVQRYCRQRSKSDDTAERINLTYL